jgi:hypothetical protein
MENSDISAWSRKKSRLVARVGHDLEMWLRKKTQDRFCRPFTIRIK